MGNVALTLIRAIPVAPASWGWHLSQAPALARWRPGQWVQGPCQLQTNWHREKWRISSHRDDLDFTTVVGMIVTALQRCDELVDQVTSNPNPAIRKANFVTQPASSDGAFKAFFFTERLRWLDVIEVRFEVSSDGGVTADAYSFSAGVCPASGFLALLVSILLFWIPFGDFGQNRIHLRTLRGLVERVPELAVELMPSSPSRAAAAATSTVSVDGRMSLS